MNDDRKDIVPGKVAIVDENGQPMNGEADAPTSWRVRRTHAKRRDFAQLHDLDEFSEQVNQLVARVNDAIPVAALAVGEKMYQQFSEETAAYLEQMEADIYARVLREIEARSWRGRLKAIRRRLAPPKVEIVPPTPLEPATNDPYVDISLSDKPRPQLSMDMVDKEMRRIYDEVPYTPPNP